MTMIIVPLNPVPNQELNIILGDHFFDIKVQEGNSETTLLTVNIDTINVLNGFKCTAQDNLLFTPEIQFGGYLFFDCADGSSYPEYEKFGTVHNLIWSDTWPPL